MTTRIFSSVSTHLVMHRFVSAVEDMGILPAIVVFQTMHLESTSKDTIRKKRKEKLA